jgi:hypothetical protein
MLCFYYWKVDGCWRLVYSTISILGSRRTKLGLRDFIALGDFFQTIDKAKVQIQRTSQFCMIYDPFSFDLEILFDNDNIKLQKTQLSIVSNHKVRIFVSELRIT